MTNEELKALLDKANTASNSGNYDEAELLTNKVLGELDKDQAEPHLNPPPKGGLPNSDSNSDSFPTGEGRDGVLAEGRDGVLENDFLYRLTSTPGQWTHLKEFAIANRKNQTFAEKTIWNLVRRKNFSTRFRRQHPIGYFIVDFVCLEFQLVIEIDGESHNQQKEYDEWRTSVLNQLGYRVIRFTNDDVLTNGEFIENEIKRNLVKDNPSQLYPASTQPHLNPPPKGGLPNSSSNSDSFPTGEGRDGVPNEKSTETEIHRASARIVLGIIANRRSNYPAALEHYEAALKICEANHDREGITKTLGGIGLVYWNLSDYTLALEYFGKALAAHEELGNKASAAGVTGNIGMVYYSLSDYPRALEYYGKALALDEELGNKAGVAGHLGNIGLVHRNLSDYPLALDYFGKALALNEELGNKAGVALQLGNFGIVHKDLSDYPLALDYYHKALAMNEALCDKKSIAGNLHNIGVVHSALSDFALALQYFQKALAINEDINNKAWIINNLGSIGNVHLNLSDYPLALDYHSKALQLAEELGDKQGVVRSLSNIGFVHGKLSDYPLALEYFAKALQLAEEHGFKEGVARLLGFIGEAYAKLNDFDKGLEYMLRSLSLSVELGNKSLGAETRAGIGDIYANTDFEGRDESKAETFLLEAIAIGKELKTKWYDMYKSLADLYKTQKRWEESDTHFRKYHDLKEEVQSEEAKKAATQMEQKRQIAEREKQLEIERTRAQEKESILNNILPEEITARLIKGENPIADTFESVSILFMDIVDFTTLSTTVTAQQLVHLLNAIFKAADGVMNEFGMEKIKTIGDAYMAVAGAPVVQADHAHRATQAALKLIDVMKNLVVKFPEEYGDRSWIESIPEIQVRIGLHCGPVAAGVVGENKFLYDLWGDAVNTASRMESHGEPGKIHCSEDFARHLTQTLFRREGFKDSFSFPIGEGRDGVLVERGEMDIKGKGMMKTYFLEKA